MSFLGEVRVCVGICRKKILFASKAFLPLRTCTLENKKAADKKSFGFYSCMLSFFYVIKTVAEDYQGGLGMEMLCSLSRFSNQVFML